MFLCFLFVKQFLLCTLHAILKVKNNVLLLLSANCCDMPCTFTQAICFLFFSSAFMFHINIMKEPLKKKQSKELKSCHLCVYVYSQTTQYTTEYTLTLFLSFSEIYSESLTMWNNLKKWRNHHIRVSNKYLCSVLRKRFSVKRTNTSSFLLNFFF